MKEDKTASISDLPGICIPTGTYACNTREGPADGGIRHSPTVQVTPELCYACAGSGLFY